MIKILKTGDEAALEAFLLPRIESSMFLLGNMRIAGFVDAGESYQGTYAAAYENGEIVAVAAHFWNGNLIFQAPAPAQLEALLPVVMGASKRAVKGLIGPDAQVTAAKQILDLHDDDCQIGEREKLYSLSLDILVEPASLSTLNGRRASLADLELLTDWRVAYNVESLGAIDSPEFWQHCHASVGRTIRRGNMWVLEENGRFLSTSGFNTATKEAVQVGGVWTPPEFRSHGYARAVVAASLRDARAEGVPKAILFTGNGNIAAQKAYEALGFRHIGDYCITILRDKG